MNPLVNTDLLTVAFVAEACGNCSEDTIEQMLRDKLLPGVKLGRSWFVPRGAFLHVVNAMAMAHMQPDAATHPASAARAAVVPVQAVELPARNVRQTPPKLGLVPTLVPMSEPPVLA